MAKKISQETFDDVVRENMEEFDMEAAEALEDAIKQFNKQGVNLSSIDISGGVGRQEVLDAIAALSSLASGGVAEGEIVAAIDSLTQLCAKEHQFSNRNRIFTMDKGGVNALHLLLDEKQSEVVIKAAAIFLNDLSKSTVEIRDFFEPGGSDRVLRLLKKYSQEPHINFEVLITILGLARTVARSENNKSALMKTGVGAVIASLVTSQATLFDEWADVLTECLLLLRGLCVHDDLRKEMSCAYENGRAFLKHSGMPAALMMLSAQFKTHPNLASAALSAARNLIATEEAVAVMSQHGAIQLIRDIFSYDASPVLLVRSAVGLMRNVCADDVRKDRLVGDGSLDLLINIMSQEQYAKDAGLMEHAVACLAQISLRSPSNAQRIVNSGAALEILARTMRRYADRSGLQRQGCLTVRNIAARGPELRPVLLDAGFEDILRQAGRMMDVVDEAYGALRDLNCEVHYVKINAEGKAEPVYEQFGTKAKLQFNPIYDEYDGLTQRVQEEARAPFASPESVAAVMTSSASTTTASGTNGVESASASAGACGDGCHDHSHEQGHGHDHGHDHEHSEHCAH